ncbi:MAG TPA: DUF3617 domain-containing protein [Allosphingosinicella sp.]|nr:DUF3617 domain-containing protein [Allosphingosinicella sp.]
MKILVLVPAALALGAMAQDSPVAMRPGQWAFTTNMTELDMPGSPADMVAAARSGLPPAETKARCLSPEQAADPAATLASPRGNAAGCVFSRRTFANGRIDVAGTCNRPSVGAVQVSLTGSFTPETVNAVIRSDVDHGTMLIGGTLTGRRLGDCVAEVAPSPS